VTDVYDLFATAIRERKQVFCTYHGAPRALCPIILGRGRGVARALTWQFGGTNEKGEPMRGQWKCLILAEVSDVQLRDGAWHAGESHARPQSCIDDVDLDVNPDSPYRPRRKL